MVTLTTTSILPAATLYMNREKLLIYAVEGERVQASQRSYEVLGMTHSLTCSEVSPCLVCTQFQQCQYNG